MKYTNDTFFEMDLNSDDAIIIQDVFNVGIDAWLEGFTRSNAAWYVNENRQHRMKVNIAIPEMPILLRRLTELYDHSENERVDMLHDDILYVWKGIEVI